MYENFAATAPVSSVINAMFPDRQIVKTGEIPGTRHIKSDKSVAININEWSWYQYPYSDHEPADYRFQRQQIAYCLGACLHILAEFARLERETLITRIKSGLEKAKKNGVTLGRKKGSVISNDMLLKKYRGVVKDLEHNISLRKIARIHSVSLCTILKVKKAMGV